MYIKNFEPQKKSVVEYAGLKREAKFWFPNIVKYVSWFIVMAVVISSCAVLIFYGVSFGKIRTYLWMTVLIFLVCFSAVITAPVRVLLFSLMNAIFIKRKPVVIKRRIRPYLLKNPDDRFRKEQVLKFRQYNANLYTPTPLHKLESRLEDIKYSLELRNLTVDIVTQVLFLTTVIYITQINKSEMSFYSTEAVRTLVVDGSLTNSIPFTKVTTYETFKEYLSETLLPALLTNIEDYDEVSKRTKRWTQEHTRSQKRPADVQKRQILDGFNRNKQMPSNFSKASVFDRGWTLNPDLKLMGKPRLRQTRVKAGTCKQLMHLKARNLECVADLTPFNVERGTFSLRWDPGPPRGLTPKQASPWSYQSAWKSQSLPIIGKFAIYPGGGYVLDLARDIDSALIVLQFLDEFQWVDMRTRAIFIEFTVYCVNTNLFNVVTLIAEKTASGFIIPSYQICTSKLILLLFELEILFELELLLLVCLLFFFLLREGLRMHRTSIVPYLKSGFTLLDLGAILLGLLSVVFIFCRRYYVSHLLKKLEEAQNNEFISFIYACTWNNWSVKMEAILICFSAFKLLRLLTFRVVFFQLHTTLTFCYKHFINLAIKQVVLILAFAFFFNLTLGGYVFGFRNFDASLLTMMVQTGNIDDIFKVNVLAAAPWYLGTLFFFFFVILITILFVNVFVAVTCFYLREVQKNPLVDKYHILEYIKHKLTKQEDIFHMKEEKLTLEDKPNPAVMRLKGGGNKPSTKKKSKASHKVKRHRRQEEENENEFTIKIKAKDFVSRRPYDTTEYQDLAVDRANAMKHLTLSLLSEDKKTQKCERQKALNAFFYSFASEKSKRMTERTSQGSYYFVVGKCTTEVQDCAKFPEMKKIVEDALRKKGWLEEEEEEEEKLSEEMRKSEDNLSILNKKLRFLLKKQKL